MSIVDQIYAAFKCRSRPNAIADASRPLISDRLDAEQVGRHLRQDLDWTFLQEHADALYAMTPDSFRYYLPQFMVLSMRQGDVTPLFVAPIFQMLDAGLDETYWSDRFKLLWSGMTSDEYEAIKAWLIFMASTDGAWEDDVVLGRAFDTIDLLTRNIER